MQLHCVRHGLTKGNLEERYQGITDGELVADQVEALRKVNFDTSQYDIIYVSPLARCIQTALCLDITDYILEPRIVERNLGIFEDLTVGEVQDRFPNEYKRLRELDEHYKIPKGESRAENLARVLEWLEDSAHYRNALAITHGGTIDFLYRLGTGVPVHGGSQIYGGDNASITHFEISWPHIRLVSYSEGVSLFSRSCKAKNLPT